MEIRRLSHCCLPPSPSARMSRSMTNGGDMPLKRITCGILVLVLSLSVGTFAKAQDNPPTPAEQYKALRKELNLALPPGGINNDADRLKFVGLAYKHHFEVAVKFLELAEKHPSDPIALDALM